ncbi:CxxCxxCC domain-containing protein [Zhenhengia yiwuensis]|uniref:YkgJ family cysteine cluster protein n=1 Tax=Zhenhengia yiwuensis TaxID=2763666 RepID=A0A926IDV4_9FIRM|nr:YkgJ family cysteine cluster protein [Zhenhengia yiwuensis]
MFKCDKCGCCCMKVGQSAVYATLDRGDGVCMYFNDELRLCNIYEIRPTMCNVDKVYTILFKSKIEKEEYYKMNRKYCEQFKSAL